MIGVSHLKKVEQMLKKYAKTAPSAGKVVGSSYWDSQDSFYDRKMNRQCSLLFQAS